MRFAIVVPNLNYVEFLRACLHSLEKQERIDLTVAIIDGGSSDGSLEVIHEYCERNKWIYEVSNGLGQAASIARGFELLSMDDDTILGWLNSDDVMLRRDSLKIVEELMSMLFDSDVISLGGYYIDKAGHFVRPVVYDYHPMLKGDIFARGGGFLQPATFWRKSVYDSVRINSQYKYVFDGDFFLRMRKNGFGFYYNPRIHVAGYRIHGNNLSLNVPALRVKELSLLYKYTLSRRCAAIYLLGIYQLLSLAEGVPRFSRYLKTAIYYLNNMASYITRYRIPSI